MTISIASPAAGSVIASNATTVTVQGTSVQKVNGVAQAAQAFSVDLDVSNYAPGPVTLSLLNSGGDVATVALTKQSPESSDGTTTIDTTAIIDANGNKWNIVGGKATMNGQAVGSRTISKLIYTNHLVWETDGTNWWYYDPGPWHGSNPPVSPSGAVVSDTTGVILDAQGNVWTLHNAGTAQSPNMQAFKNGAMAGNSNGVGILLYYGGFFYTTYTGATPNTWWKFDGSNWQSVPGDPRPTYPASTFWGVNGHLTWQNPAGYKEENWPNNANAMRDLGMMTYRNGYGANYSATNGAITSSDGAAFLRFMNANPDIVVAPVLLPMYLTDWTGATATESTAYTIGYNLGRDAATNLKGKVPWYEVGNEMEASCITGGSGYSKGSYDNAKYLMCRGSILGMIAGIRSVDTTTPIAWPGGTWCHMGFFFCLMDGSTPAAPTTYDTTKIPVFQIKSWHWYVNGSTTNDPITNVQGQGVPNNDMLAAIQSCGPTNLPLIITEYGVNTVNTGTGAALVPNSEFTDLTGGLTTAGLLMDKWLTLRTAYAGMPIIAVMMYELVDTYNNVASPNMSDYTVQNEMGFGLIASDGTTKKAHYAAVKAFVAAHAIAPTLV